MSVATDTVLSIQNLEVVYSDVIVALRGVSLDVPTGAIVALLGANGAGKTTVLRAISGLLPTHRGRITKGSISLDGTVVNERSSASLVGHGVVQVMEGRRLFAELTVQENLRAGALVRRPSRDELAARVREGRRIVPRVTRPLGQPGRLPVRRGAADGRHRPGRDGQASPAPPRRAVARPRTTHRRADPRRHRRHQPARHGCAPHRAERADGAVDRRPRVRARERQDRQGRIGRRAAW